MRHALLSVFVLLATAASAAAQANKVIVDGNSVDPKTIGAIAVGDVVTGSLAQGDNVFYAWSDPATGTSGGYYEDLYELTVSTSSAIDITMSANVLGEAWIDLFKWDPTVGEYVYFWSADASVDGGLTAQIAGTIEPGSYLVGASTWSELAAIDYMLSVQPYAGTDPAPIGAGSGIVYDGGVGIYTLDVVYMTLSADGGAAPFAVSAHSSAVANNVVELVRGTVKKHNGRFLGGALRAMLKANGKDHK